MNKTFINRDYICNVVCTQKECNKHLCPIWGAPASAIEIAVVDYWTKTESGIEVCPVCGKIRPDENTYKCPLCCSKLYDEKTSGLYEMSKERLERYGAKK